MRGLIQRCAGPLVASLLAAHGSPNESLIFSAREFPVSASLDFPPLGLDEMFS